MGLGYLNSSLLFRKPVTYWYFPPAIKQSPASLTPHIHWPLHLSQPIIWTSAVHTTLPQSHCGQGECQSFSTFSGPCCTNCVLPVISSLSGSRVNIIRHQTWLYQKALCSGKVREKSGSDLGALLSWHSVTDVVKILRTHKGLQDKFAQEYFVSLSHTLLY